MFKRNQFYIFITVILIAFLLISLPLFSDPIEKVVATVNGESISLSELEDYAKPYIETGKLDRNNRDDMLNLLNVMIDEELIFQICKENGIEITDERISKLIDSLKNKLKTDNMDIILKYLNAPNEYVLKRKLKIDMGMLSMINKVKIGEELDFFVKQPADSDVTEYYTENSHLFKEAEERSISHILITFEKDNTQEKKQAKDFLVKLIRLMDTDTATFEMLADKYSHDYTSKGKGGNLGYYTKRELEKAFPSYAERVFSTAKGKITKIIEMDKAFSIIKVNDVRMREEKTVSEVYDAIYDELLTDNFYDAFGPYFNEYKNDAVIEIMY
jgi:parvulin-like peptidyl-prolyl isomerase